MSNIVLSQGQFVSGILASLLAAPSYTAPGKDIRNALIGAAGGDPTLTAHINAVNNARSTLKERGLVGDGPNRGDWVLTDEGVAVAKGDKPMPKGGRSPKPATATTDATDPAPAVEVPATVPATELARVEDAAPAAVEAPEPAAVEAPAAPAAVEAPSPKRRLKVAQAPSAPAVEVPEWLSDEGIRAAVIEGQECFGAFAARSPACGECALSGFCRNAKAAQFVLLANKLATSTPATPSPLAAPVAKLDGAVGDALNPAATRAAANPTAGTLSAAYDGTCAVSSRPIKKGDLVKYIPGKGMVHADVA